MTDTIAATTDTVLAERRGGLGLISLNRPKALNALDVPMVDALDRQLAAWSADDRVEAVAIQGLGGKAFCAGGDVRAFGLLPTPAARRALAIRFFSAEYRLNHRINTYPKPYIALLDGITMGGGLGVSVHGSHRVATERTLMAMPETVLGLFPDIGASWFLNRCPGAIGLYLGLTGQRLGAADALTAGLATHFVASDDIPTLVAALAAAGGLDLAAVDSILAAHMSNPGPGALAGRAEEIAHLFDRPSIEAVIAALRGDGGDLAREALSVIDRASPTSLKLTFRQLSQARGLQIAAALEVEYRLAVRAAAAPDFAEGIRAILIDKDQSPHWQPAQLDAVDDAAIDRLFAPFEDPQDELRL